MEFNNQFTCTAISFGMFNFFFIQGTAVVLGSLLFSVVTIQRGILNIGNTSSYFLTILHTKITYSRRNDVKKRWNSHWILPYYLTIIVIVFGIIIVLHSAKK